MNQFSQVLSCLWFASLPANISLSRYKDKYTKIYIWFSFLSRTDSLQRGKIFHTSFGFIIAAIHVTVVIPLCHPLQLERNVMLKISCHHLHIAVHGDWGSVEWFFFHCFQALHKTVFPHCCARLHFFLWGKMKLLKLKASLFIKVWLTSPTCTYSKWTVLFSLPTWTKYIIYFA